MSHAIVTINLLLLILFNCCYAYQVFFLIVGLFVKDKVPAVHAVKHRFAVLIPARNEQTVLPGLLRSIRAQDYPAEMISVYVIADNCTDNTAEVARALGARVIVRHNTLRKGKGYALDDALQEIDRTKGFLYYDAYFVFDADNVLDKGYFTAMNQTFSQGYEMVTSYRNSKNYDANWISAGYALWFLRENRFLNGARMKLGLSCTISGTGFMVSSRVLMRDGGWKYHLLTEDIEFSTDHIIRGDRIGYCKDAILYDEQPLTFRDSWNQRLRWTKGFYQVLGNYGGRLVGGVLKRHSFPCFDILMVLASATLITLLSVLFNSSFLVAGSLVGAPFVLKEAVTSCGMCLANIYAALFLYGLITLIAEHRQIHCSFPRQMLYLTMFPVFIFTYIPMALVALKKDVEWVQIPHSVQLTPEQICANGRH